MGMGPEYDAALRSRTNVFYHSNAFKRIPQTLFGGIDNIFGALPPSLNDILSWTLQEEPTTTISPDRTSNNLPARFVSSPSFVFDGSTGLSIGPEAFQSLGICFSDIDISANGYVANNYNGTDNVFELFTTTAGVLLVYIRSGGTIVQHLSADIKPYLDGYQHSLVFQQNEDYKTIKIFIDGVLKDSYTSAAAYPINSTTKLDIGHRQGDARRMGGKMHKFAIYDRKLTTEEMQLFKSDPPEDAICLLPFENHIYDVSGNNNHATLDLGTETYENADDYLHWNIRKGYGLDASGDTVPKDAEGEYVVAVTEERPSGAWHNGADTSIALGVVAGPGEWYEVSSGGFNGRQGHKCLSFDGKIWVIAGQTTAGYQKDVWYSADNGLTWTEATGAAAFTARAFHAAVVFDSKMWVIGGISDDGLLNDVWHSTDGATWTEATASAAFSGRRYHSAVVFDSKMWVIGGTDGGNKNDVWSSSDGITWTDAAASGHFSARYAHESVVFDSKMWVIAGFDGTRLDDVWSSSDGVTWTETASAAFPARSYFCAAVFNSKMWVIAGFDNPNLYNDVWFTEDGVSWYEYQQTSSFSARRFPSCTVDNGEFYLIGGGDGSRLNDVHTLASDWIIDSRVQDADTEELLHNSATGLVRELSYSDLKGVFHGDYLYCNITEDYKYSNLILYKKGLEPTGPDSRAINRFVGNVLFLITAGGEFVYDANGHVITVEP